MATHPQLPKPIASLCIALLIAILVSLLPIPFTPQTASAQGNCTTTTLDWDPADWTQNGATTVAGGNTYAVQNIFRQTFGPAAPGGQRHVNLDFQFSGSTDDFNSTLPNDTTAVTPGGGSESLEADFTFDSENETITLLITFDTNVTQLAFTIHDVDRVNDNNDDRIVITGRDSANTVQSATVTNGANNTLSSSAGNSYTVDGIGSGGSGVATAGNVTVNFGTNSIRTVTLVFGNNPAGSSVAAQEMALGDITFCAPTAPVCSTSAGELNWGAGTILSPGNANWTPTGSLSQTFTVPETSNGASLDFNFVITGNTSHFAQNTPAVNSTITGGYLPFDNQSLLFAVDPPSAASVITVTIDLSVAVHDLYFQVFDTDVSNDDSSPTAPNTADNDRRDVVTVVGYNSDVNQTVLPAMIGVSSSSLQDNILIGNTFSGINGGSDTGTQGAPNTSNEANMDIRFADPVNRITIRYEEGGGGSNPAARGIALSDIQFCHPPALAVQLNAFEAVCRPDDVLVFWETASEINTLGFNLYRSITPTTIGERLNSELIPSEATGSGHGAFYEFVDNTVPEGTFYYTLEDVDMNGYSTLHDSISASFPCPPTAITLVDIRAGTYSDPPLLLLVGIILATLFLVRFHRSA